MFHNRQRTAQPHSWHKSSHQQTPNSMHASGISGTLSHVATEARMGVRRELLDYCPTWRRRREWAHSQYTSVQYSLFTSAERTSRAWLKGQHGSSNHGLHFIFVRLKRICHLGVAHVSPFVVLTPSRITMARRLAQWRTPAHHNSQKKLEKKITKLRSLKKWRNL